MEHREMQCGVCDHNYSDKVLPRNLGCGHSVCSTCIEFIILTNKKCPECRSPFLERSASELPVNHSLLRVSRVFASKRLDSDVKTKPKLPLCFPLSEPKQNAGKCHAHSCSMFFMCLRCLVAVCRDCLIEDHKDPPFGRCLVLSIAEAMDKIKNSYTKTTDIYLVKAQAILLELKKGQRTLTMCLKAFESIRDGEDLVSAKEDLEELHKQNQGVLDNLTSLETLLDSMKDSNLRLTDASSPENIKMLVKDIADCHSAFEKYQENDKGLQNILQILLGNEKDLKHLVETGKPTYAVKEEEETIKWTSISLRNQKLHLYSLSNVKPPENGICLPFYLVREIVPKESPVIFLEVGWQGEIKGHVYIRLFGDTPRSQQASFLCSGEKGPSYRNTRFYDLNRYIDGSLVLSGGDYANNDGSGGRAIIEGITCGGPYRHEIRAGLLVSGHAPDNSHLGSFDIHLKDARGSYDFSAHGIVEHGLEILREAADMMSEIEPFVMDCGLVIPT